MLLLGRRFGQSEGCQPRSAFHGSVSAMSQQSLASCSRIYPDVRTPDCHLASSTFTQTLVRVLPKQLIFFVWSGVALPNEVARRYYLTSPSARAKFVSGRTRLRVDSARLFAAQRIIVQVRTPMELPRGA